MLTSLTSQTLKQAAALTERIEQMMTERNNLLAGTVASSGVTIPTGNTKRPGAKKGRFVSPETKAKMKAAAAKRWKAVRKAQKAAATLATGV